MSRYMEAPENIVDMMNSIKKEYFPQLVNCKIKILMDSKKKMNKGSFVFGRIKSTNELERYLTSSNLDYEGSDFIMFLDSNLFDNITNEDKIRIIRHELRHIFFDSEAKNPYKIIDHDINDFKIEVELNREDPDWDLRVASIADAIYNKDE